MRARSHESSFFRRFIRPLFIGIGVGVLVCFILLMGFSLVVRSVDVPQRAATPLAVGSAAAGAFVAGWVTAAITKEKGLLLGLGCGAVLFILITIAGLVRIGHVGIGMAAIKLAVLTLAGGIGGVIGVNRRHR